MEGLLTFVLGLICGMGVVLYRLTRVEDASTKKRILDERSRAMSRRCRIT